VLATQLCITPETLSRLFSKLKLNGLIKESGSYIIIPDFNFLCREVDLDPRIFKEGY
jgi:CRP/FNR family transcriptional regulator